MAELNRLSCTRCKDRKVRCSRVMPICGRCKTQDLECIYPERQKRRSNKPPPERTGVPNEALSTILERLQRVEEQCVALPGENSPGGATAPSPAYTPRPMQTQLPPITTQYPSIQSPSMASTSWDGQATSLRPWRGPSAPGTAASTPAAATPGAHTDATAVLKDAVDQVQKKRLQTYSASVVTEEINVPRELAKTWIRNYFVHKPQDMFLSLIDKNFVEMIPDMMSFPHVHLDSCVMIIYYGVLWHGCSIFAGREPLGGVKKWSKLTYLGCLRAIPGWQREATGTITDLIAAITMARVCGESFDYEMAWKMFKLAADYAQDLGLHTLDGPGAMMGGIHNPEISDDDRKSFWDLIQADIFFRLMFNKPPSISGNAWQVNLPWLDLGSQGGVAYKNAPRPDTAMMFLVSSRVTMVVMRFFSMLEECAGDVIQMRRRTEDMCREIKCLYDEWNLTEWAKKLEANELDTWSVAEVAMNGYTCIIFMLRKVASLDGSNPVSSLNSSSHHGHSHSHSHSHSRSHNHNHSTSSNHTSPQPIPFATDADIPDSPLALDAARNLVDIVGWLLAKYPNPMTLASTFGAFRAYVPFAYLVSHILRSAEEVNSRSQSTPGAAGQGQGDVRAVFAADLEGLERAGRSVEAISGCERDFVPLARAIQSLNDEVRRKVG